MTTPNLNPSKAKLAAQVLKSQQGEIESFKTKVAELETELSSLKRFNECVKLAHQLSEKGIVSKNFDTIMEKAESLAESGKDLSVFKEAIDMAQSNFDLGSPDNSKTGLGRGIDVFTEALISLA